MMDYQSGQWVISCDDCDEILETNKKDKEEAIEVAANNGWRMGKLHYCEQCKDEHD